MVSATPKAQQKTQRLFDLLAALLRHGRGGIALADLPNEVPGYWGADKNPASVAMMFERDKAELRDLGINIETVEDDIGNSRLYRLNPSEFLLPLLKQSETATVGGGGNRTLSSRQPMYFTADELKAMLRGTHLLSQLGYVGLADQARAGLRRLSHDLALEEDAERPETVRGETEIDQGIFEQLSDAVQRRKRVSFLYHALDQPVPKMRRVLPFGLACIEGRWSLFAHDEDANGIRQFRLRRLRDIAVNPKNKATPDFEVPSDFDLWERTRHRFEWELGEAEPEEIVVEFVVENGLTVPALQQGAPVPESPIRRAFQVRRREPFLRWVLAFAGDAVVAAPPDAEREFRQLAIDVTKAHLGEVSG